MFIFLKFCSHWRQALMVVNDSPGFSCMFVS